MPERAHRFLAAHAFALALIAIGGAASGGAYLGGRLMLAEDQIAYLTASQDAQAGAIRTASGLLAVQFRAAAQNSANLSQQLSQKEQAGAQLQSALNDIQGGIDFINKERAVDPQLLEKYSRVYFLNENYRPAALATIPARFSSPTTTVREIQAQVLPFLERMLTDADAAHVHLRIASAYRSFYDQSSLKSTYTVQYGSGANSFSADQGYSEHQLGTAVDFTTAETGGLTGFEKTTASNWLAVQAYRYGFVLSYPKGNDYYIYEPWHWRFVGVALATYLHEHDLRFYDLDQRTIDTYRAGLFDQ